MLYYQIVTLMITQMLLSSTIVSFHMRLQASLMTNVKLVMKPSRTLQMAMSSTSAGTDDDDKPYVVRPKDVKIPLARLEFNFARSSGPGGQNVNKLNTKAEIRFHVQSADWISADVKNRLAAYFPNKINKEGEIVVTAQEHRTQAKNKDDCVVKLQEMIAEAMIEPKERDMWMGIGGKGKAIRRQNKQHRSEVKSSRRSSSRDCDY